MKHMSNVWLLHDFRGLRMLSLVLGTEITDASVVAISQNYSKLELLDLSGYVLEQVPITFEKLKV
jgi:hypothetical protein